MKRKHEKGRGKEKEGIKKTQGRNIMEKNGKEGEKGGKQLKL